MPYGYELRDGNLASVAEHPADVPAKLAAVVESVKEVGAETCLAARQSVEHVCDTALDYVRAGERRIRTEPTRALLTATAVGFVLGVLFIRR